MKYLLILSILILSVLHAQDNKGYYNSKFYVSIETLLNTPIFYNGYGKDYVTSYDKSLVSKLNWLNYGFRTSFGLILKRNVAFVLEFGVDRAKCYTPRNITHHEEFIDNKGYENYNDYKYHLKMESLNSNSFYFMPRFEFTNKLGLLPMGLTHSVGIGICRSYIQNKNYNVEIFPGESYVYDSLTNYHEYLDEEFTPVITDYKDKMIDINNQIPAKSIQLMYALSIKTALTKKIFLNYGLRYNFNLVNIFQRRSEFVNYKGGYYLSSANIIYCINRQKTFNFMNFTLGLTYAL